MEFCLNKTKLRCGKHDFKIEVVVGMYVLINRCFCFSLFILYMHGDVCSKLFCYYTSPLFITVTVPLFRLSNVDLGATIVVMGYLQGVVFGIAVAKATPG
jgi:hypothetical protein